MGSLYKALGLTAALSVLIALTLTPPVSAATSAVSGQVTVSATQAWTDTGIDVAGQVTLRASGTIDVGGPEPNLPPSGSASCKASTSQYSGDWVALGFPCWSLIARVANNSPFFVGQGDTFRGLPSGRLFLGVDDETAAFGDNSGSWSVTVETAASSSPGGEVAAPELKKLADNITNALRPVITGGGPPPSFRDGVEAAKCFVYFEAVHQVAIGGGVATALINTNSLEAFCGYVLDKGESVQQKELARAIRKAVKWIEDYKDAISLVKTPKDPITTLTALKRFVAGLPPK